MTLIVAVYTKYILAAATIQTRPRTPRADYEAATLDAQALRPRQTNRGLDASLAMAEGDWFRLDLYNPSQHQVLQSFKLSHLTIKAYRLVVDLGTAAAFVSVARLDVPGDRERRYARSQC